MTTTTTAPAPSACAPGAAPLEGAAVLCPSPPVTEVLDSHRELRTRDDLDDRIRQLIPCATQRQLWLLLLDGDDVQMPVMVPIGDLPLWGATTGRGADGEGLVELLRSIQREFDAGSYVFVLERPGPAVLDADDVSWLQHVLSCGDRAAFVVRAAYVCHESGHAGFEPAEVGALAPGLRLPSHETRCATCPVLATVDEVRAEAVREERNRGEAVPAVGATAAGGSDSEAEAGVDA